MPIVCDNKYSCRLYPYCSKDKEREMLMKKKKLIMGALICSVFLAEEGEA